MGPMSGIVSEVRWLFFLSQYEKQFLRLFCCGGGEVGISFVVDLVSLTLGENVLR